jgi:predicted ATP-dependent endonuclease of OLD family
MKIEELEIENYKCINNKGMPQKFSDLNIFIGEND